MEKKINDSEAKFQKTIHENESRFKSLEEKFQTQQNHSEATEVKLSKLESIVEMIGNKFEWEKCKFV